MRSLAFLALLLISTPTVGAQLPPPNATGVSAGHLHMMVRDPDAHKKIWVDVLGAAVVNAGTLEMLKLPGIF
jgi:catechol-2,3-dioxygenase